MDWVTSVWRYMPTTLYKPSQVQQDGKGGVTQETFNEFLELTQERVTERLTTNSLDVPDWTLDPGSTLESVVAQVTAGYILRKFPNFQQLYKDYFANGFATLDDYINEEKASQGMSGAPEFVDVPEDDTTGYGFPTDW